MHCTQSEGLSQSAHCADIAEQAVQVVGEARSYPLLQVKQALAV
jgi:hypothetical protein